MMDAYWILLALVLGSMTQRSGSQMIPHWVTDNTVPSTNRQTCGADLTASLEAMRSQLQLLEQQISGLCQQGGCPSPYVRLGGRCYRFARFTAAWYESRKVCQVEGGDLVSFQTAKEETDVKKYITETLGWPEYESRFWTSGNEIEKKGDWRWGTGPLSEGISYTNFIPGEPNNHNGQSEECMEFNSQEERGWNDAPCHLMFNYICELANIDESPGTDTAVLRTKPETSTTTTMLTTTPPMEKAVGVQDNAKYTYRPPQSTTTPPDYQDEGDTWWWD